MAKWRVKASKKDGSVDELYDVGKKNDADAAVAREAAKAKKGEVVTQHLCPHAAGESPEGWFDCRRDPRAQFVEFTKT